jgi:hypothetical protein
MEDPEKVQIIAKGVSEENIEAGEPLIGSEPMIEKVHAEEGVIPVQQAPLVSRLYYFCQFLAYLGVTMMLIANIVWYTELWSLPNEEAKEKGFQMNSAPIQAVYLTGMLLFGLSSIYVLIKMDAQQKGFWWMAYIGLIFTFMEMAIVINRDFDFVHQLVLEKFNITGGHKALYVVSSIAVILVSPTIGVLHMFGEYTAKPSRFHKSLVWMGILMYQVSTIVAVHSYVVQVGFGFTIFGIVIFLVGFLLGKYELRQKQKMLDALIE